MPKRLLLLLAFLQPTVVFAAIAVEGTATTSETTASTSHTISLPASIQNGEALVLILVNDGNAASCTATGYSFIDSNTASSSSATFCLGYKQATGSEGATVTVTTNSSNTLTGHAVRLSGVNTADITNADNFSSTSVGSALSTFSISANTLTGLTSGDGVIVVVAAEASRSVTSADADLALIGNEVGNPSVHAYIDLDAGGTGNAQYDFTMSGTRDYDLFMVNIEASSASGSSLRRRRAN